MKINYFDIHSHLDFPKFDEDKDDVISRMKDEGIFTITVGTDLEDSRKAVALAEKHENIYATIGLHPNDNHKENFDENDYVDLVKSPKVVAIGECGLEFFNLTDKQSLSVEEEKKRQIEIFKSQIDFAVKYDKPLMIHTRDAHIETIKILEEKKNQYGEKLRGNIHFFSGDTDLAKKYIDLGFTISFTGVITFAKDYDEVIKNISLDKIMSETDAPFVAPVPFRGKRCEPSYVKEVVKRIAEIKGLDFEQVRDQMVKNALREFKIAF